LPSRSQHAEPPQTRHAEDHYRSLSRELTLDEWLRTQLPKRYIDNVMRLTSALH